VIPCRPDEAEGFGLLKTDEKGKITEFKEKPKGEALEAMRVDTSNFGLSEEESRNRPFLASMGIYVFNYERLIELLHEEEGRLDFGREVIPTSIQKLNVQAHFFKDYWEDIGTIRSFYEANLDLASPLPKFNFFNTEAPIYTRSRYLPPSKVQSCDIDNSMISEGCILNGVYARNSIFGLRCRVDKGSRIESSIIMGSDFFESIEEIQKNINRQRPNIGIGNNVVIRRAIVDKNTRIGNNVQLVNKDNIETRDGENGCYYIREGIIIVPKNATIPDGMVI
jgi:glucose-1-phosphate adenylyltransferase